MHGLHSHARQVNVYAVALQSLRKANCDGAESWLQVHHEPDSRRKVTLWISVSVHLQDNHRTFSKLGEDGYACAIGPRNMFGPSRKR